MHARSCAILLLLLGACSDDALAPARPEAVALIPAPLPPSEHRMNILASPDTLDSEALRVNASGAAIGYFRNRWGHTFGVVWDSTGLPSMLADSASVLPTDISDYGVITANQGTRARVYLQPRAATVLPLASGQVESRAEAINWRHTIVGTSLSSTGARHAATWVYQGKTAWMQRMLPRTRDVVESAALDINAVGDVLGWVRTAGATPRGRMWFASGAVADLGALGSLRGLRLNNKQQVLLDVKGLGMAVLDARSLSVDWTLGAKVSTTFTALNDAGRVVGTAAYSLVHGSSVPSVPVTWFLPGIRSLEELPYSFSASTYPPGSANDVNLCGVVVGALRRHSNITSRAVRWDKVADECDVDEAPVLRVVPRD